MKKILLVIGLVCIIVPIVCALLYVLGVWNIGNDRGVMAAGLVGIGIVAIAVGDIIDH
jgi:hypothetical protein